MSKKQLIIKSLLPAIFEKNIDKEQYLGEGYTPEVAKSFCPKVLDVKKEYHSLNEKERQWITQRVLNAEKGFTYGIVGFVFVMEALALMCWWFGIDSVDYDVLVLISASTVFVSIIGFIVIPLRNRRLLKRIKFENVQECIIHDIIYSGYGKGKNRYYAILQWDEESQKFYEVLYVPLSKCYSGDIVYHPYGMKYYIPKMKE